MSIDRQKFLVIFFAFVAVLLPGFSCRAQDLDVKIKVISLSPAIARVEGRILREDFRQSGKNWTLLNSFAGIENLGARVSDLKLKDQQNREIAVRRLMDGEYLAESEAAAWSYQVNINPLSNEKALAHVSWASGEQGILMTNDLLPQFVSKNNQPVSARIEFELPENWKIVSAEKNDGANVFESANIEKAVFLIGKDWREEKFSEENLSLDAAISGDWKFSDVEAMEAARDILQEYRNLFGEVPEKKARIFLVRFPAELKFGRWEADTRGSTVIIISSDMPFKTLSLQKLHEQLRHELFHLWMPNNLALTGNYDWFYEGFTVYQSLKTGVEMNRIRFEDFLATLSEAYNLDNFQDVKVSLVEAAKNRWNGANPQVYSRGMIVAFLCDVALLRESRGKKSLSDVFKQIYGQFKKPNNPQDGNAAILSILEKHPELQTIIEKYIKGTEPINWQNDLESVGIQAERTNFAIKLSTRTQLKDRQKDLLNKLGYNNWRKITKK